MSATPAAPPRRTLRRICVFCGSSRQSPARYLEIARQTGRALAHRGIGLVYGGSSIGLMGALADAVLAAGGHATGVITEKLLSREIGHDRLDELFVVESMHARKLMMAQLADGFIALPGGTGTLEELLEAAAWTGLGLHHKPVGVLNAFGYYDLLLRFLSHAADERFIRPDHRGLIQAAAEPEALLDQLATARLPLPQALAADRP